MPEPTQIDKPYDVLVVGGGLAGVCAAISAARLGCDVALIQDRPVLGGNASSEIRVPIGGAQSGKNRNARETGIIEEFRIENAYRNPEGSYPLRDAILWELVDREPHIDLYLNTRAKQAVMDRARMVGVVADQDSTERTVAFKGSFVIDASGDGWIAYSAGAEYRMGREGRSEFNESRAPEQPDQKTLGSTLYFVTRDMGHPVSFRRPYWARVFASDADLPFRHHSDPTDHIRFWWIEYGGVLDTIKDNERIRDELTRVVYGLWDHIKNRGDHGAENLALDWIGTVSGKRESRRFVGDYILNQSDLESGRIFPDQVAYGGWPIDTHPPEGIYASEKPCDKPPLPGLYSIPLRCLYSKNIENLMFAGRNISASHVAFASMRLMATCAVEGQAVGTAAYLCREHGTNPRGVYENHIQELQQLLLRHDAYLIDVQNEDPEDLARNAHVTASSCARAEDIQEECFRLSPGEPTYDAQNVVNGVARPAQAPNIWISDPAQGMPQYLELDFGEPRTFREIHLKFDTHLDARVRALNVPVPGCVKDYRIHCTQNGGWHLIHEERGNYHRHRVHSSEPITSQRVRIDISATNGAREARVYEVRIYG